MLTTRPLTIFSLQNGTHFSNHLIRRHGTASDENIGTENNTKKPNRVGFPDSGWAQPVSIRNYINIYILPLQNFIESYKHTHTNQ